MSEYVFKFLCALIVGLIVFVAGLVLDRTGLPVSVFEASAWGVLCALVVLAVMVPAVMKRVKHICCDFDWAEETVQFYQRIPVKFRQSFWLLFMFINLAFLFYTIHFMWGNEDWGAVRFAVQPEEGLKSGDFSAYWLQELLFDGKLLPVINNLWAFAGLSMAGVLLSVYWGVPQRATPMVVVGLLFAVTPYSMSVLYFAKTMLGICWLPAMVLTALMLAEKQANSEIEGFLNNLFSVLLLLWAMGTYMPVIDFILVALLGKVLLKTVYADISMSDAFKRVLQSVVNFSAALMIYVFVLYILKTTGRLSAVHAEALDLTAPLLGLPMVIKYMFWQFALPLPFMDMAYRVVYLGMVLVAVFMLIYKAPSTKASIRGLILLPFILLATLWALGFVAEPDLHFGRISFLGLPFFYTLMFIVIIRLGGPYMCRVGYVLAVLLVFMNFVRVAYAQKVWKFGWDAETKLAERIITRLEKMPEFNIDLKYKLLQVGEQSLRSKYYKKQPHEFYSGELLSRAYYPEGAAKEAYNFFYQADFLEEDDAGEALSVPEIRHYLLNKARPWPYKESLFIFGQYIVIVLDDTALALLQKKLN